MRTYADPPATFVRGAGTVLFDAEGNEYLDFITGLAVVSLATPPGRGRRRGRAGADPVPRLEPVREHPGPEVARTIDRLINGGTGRPAARSSSPTRERKRTSAH